MIFFYFYLNTEQEQESLVNRLWKRMERLESEKRLLQEKLDTTASPSSKLISNAMTSALTSTSSGTTGLTGLSIPSAAAIAMVTGTTASEAAAGGGLSGALPNSLLLGPLPSATGNNSDQAATLTEHIINLRREVSRLKANLEKAERDHKENMAKLVREEKLIKEENVRLQRRLQMEVDRREALCRHLSESESSLEMDDERHFNESTRVRTISSPIPSYVMQTGVAAGTAPGVSTGAGGSSVAVAAISGSTTIPMITSQMLAAPMAMSAGKHYIFFLL